MKETMKIGIAVVGHERRYLRAEDLADKVKAEAISFDLETMWNDEILGSLGPEKNHLRAWSWLKDSALDWAVVLEDDALPVEGFQEELEAALSVAPSPVVGLYLGRGRPPHWIDSIASVMASPACWLVGTELLNCVGVAIKGSLLPVLIDYLKVATTYDDDPLLKSLPIDEMISAWLIKRGIKVAYSHPSLVDHDVSLPTLIRYHKTGHVDEVDHHNRSEQRIAWMCGTRSRGWSDSTMDIPTPIQVDGGYQVPYLPGNLTG